MRLKRILLFLFLLLLFSSAGWSGPRESVTGDFRQYDHYTSVDQLVAVICRDAMEKFEGFYLSSRVSLKPFRVVSSYRAPEITLLGISLADQMMSELSDLPTLSWRELMVKKVKGVLAGHKRCEPELEGLIEELDGYLRVRITIRNSFGEKRDFSASAEMSEPVYEALHSGVGIF